MKAEIRELQNGQCAICDEPLPEDESLYDLDHIVPRSGGGAWAPDNLQVVHVRCNAKKSDQREADAAARFINRSSISVAVRAREEAQRLRMAWNNRVLAAKRFGMDEARQMFFEDQATAYAAVEKDAEKYLRQVVAEEETKTPILAIMQQVPGVGPVMAARVVEDIDIERADSISALWRFAGYSVKDGGRERRVKGEKASHNRRLKIAVRNLVEQFLKLGDGSVYGAAYRERKAQREAADWGKSKGHRHNDAIGYVGKLFLSHLWLEWRKLEGLSVSDPFIIGKEGHEHIKTPQDFGWPD